MYTYLHATDVTRRFAGDSAGHHVVQRDTREAQQRPLSARFPRSRQSLLHAEQVHCTHCAYTVCFAEQVHVVSLCFLPVCLFNNNSVATFLYDYHMLWSILYELSLNV